MSNISVDPLTGNIVEEPETPVTPEYTRMDGGVRVRSPQDSQDDSLWSQSYDEGQRLQRLINSALRQSALDACVTPLDNGRSYRVEFFFRGEQRILEGSRPELLAILGNPAELARIFPAPETVPEPEPEQCRRAEQALGGDPRAIEAEARRKARHRDELSGMLAKAKQRTVDPVAAASEKIRQLEDARKQKAIAAPTPLPVVPIPAPAPAVPQGETTDDQLFITLMQALAAGDEHALESLSQIAFSGGPCRELVQLFFQRNAFPAGDAYLPAAAKAAQEFLTLLQEAVNAVHK